MLNAYITSTGSISPLGLTALETTESILNNKNCLSLVPSGTFPDDFPIKFIGLMPNQSLTGFSTEDLVFEKNKKYWLENLFANFDYENANIDYIIFSHNYAPNYYECLNETNNNFYLNPKRTICNTDFIKFFSLNSDKATNVPFTDIHNTCASSLAAIALAKNYIQVGLAKSCLVIAYEISNNQRPLFLSLNTLGALNSKANSINRASVPFSDDRAGFVKSDAIGYVLVQTEALSKLSGNEPISKISGSAITSDCHNLTDGIEDGSMVESTIRQCLSDALTTPDKIDYINSHGSGTYLNDKIELCGIKKVFGSQSKTVYMSSNKSQFGHALCATGIVEVDILNKMFQKKIIAPNLNFISQHENNNIIIPNFCITNEKIKFALKNSFGFGGYNASMVFENLL